MAIDDPAGNGSRQTPAKQCKLNHLYLKDASFEAPHVPGILFWNEQPELVVTVHDAYTLRVDDIPQEAGEVYDVEVHMSVRATAGGKCLFLVEVKQGGLVELLGYGKEEADFVLRTRGVEALYPYVRELVNSLVVRGGFPRLALRPLDFESRYSQAMEEYQQSVQQSHGQATDPS